MPCGRGALPSYAGLNDSAIVKSWSRSEFGRDWAPPACLGWKVLGFSTLITTAARFRSTSDTKELLRHIGAISELAGLRYWSTTHQQWQTFILGAHALTSSQSGKPRKDFTPEEIAEGQTVYFEQQDNLAGKAIYRMHIAGATNDHLVFSVENVNPIRRLFISILNSGEMQSIYFLDRESENVWRYYSMVRTGKNANGLIAGNESSSINRAVAFYRYFVGIPAMREPPAAR